MAPARGWWCAGPASESAVSLPAVPHLVTAQSGPLLELEQRILDALQLGTDTASSLGVDARTMRLLAIGVVAVLVGAATALTGVIGFVGLIVPHVARLLAGPGHRVLLPLASALGAFVVLLVDLATRMGKLMLPPGVITSLLGAPFFLWLLHRYARGLP